GHLVNNGTTVLMISTKLPQILIATGQSGTYSNASLSGRYSVVIRQFQPSTVQGSMPPVGMALPAPIGFQTTIGSVVIDGAGNFAASGREDIDGRISFSNLTAASYTVASDGTLT